MAHVLEDSCVELIDGYVVNNWIVNLVYRQVEVYTDPGTGTYHCRVDFRPGQDVPVVIDGAEVGRIAVAYILP